MAPTLTGANVRTGISGEFLVGATTATAPASAIAATTGFTGLGYFSEAGVVPKLEKSTKDIKAWQNNAVTRTLTTDAKITYSFTIIETSKATIEFVFSTTVTQSATEGTYTIDPSASGGRKSFVFDVIDGALLRREYIAEGELTEMTPTGFVNGEAVAYDCTVTAYTSPVVHDTSLKTPA